MHIRTHSSSLAAVALLLGSLAIAAPAFAVDVPSNEETAAPASDHAMKAGMSHNGMMKGGMHHMMSPEDMAEHVEHRIQMLHTKLNIKPEQETAWAAVAAAMRDSEKETAALIQQRHESSETRTAVDDMESYQKIAQSHADGMVKVVNAFAPLYNSMPDDQKKNADMVFGHFEGHRHGDWKHGTHHMIKNADKPTKAN